MRIAEQAYLRDFGQLTSALSADDLSRAQQAFRRLGAEPGVRGPEVGEDPIQADMEQLENALQAGDLKAAQAAFEQLQADIAATHGNELNGTSPGRTVSLLG